MSPGLTVQRDVAMILQPYFAADGLVTKCLDYAADLDHVMDFTRLRALGSLFSMLNQNVRNVIIYNNNHPDFPMQVHTCDYTNTYFLVIVSNNASLMEPYSRLKFENESFPLAARSTGKVHPEGLSLFSAMGLVWRREAQVSSGVGRFHQRSDNCTVTITNQCPNHRL